MDFIRRFIPLAVLLAAIGVVYYLGLHEYLSLRSIADNKEVLQSFVDSQFLSAALLYGGVYILIVAFSLPAAFLVTITGGFLFGWFLGGLLAVTSATIGATILFFIAGTSLGAPLRARAGPWMEKISQGFQDNAFYYLLFLRLVPAFPFWLVNLAPALLGVSVYVFFTATFVGIIPGTFAFSFLGSGLESIIDSQRAVYDICVAQNGLENCDFSLDPSALITGELVAAFVALGFVALIPVGIKKLRGRV